MKTKILLGLAVVFLAMQAFRPARNLTATAPFSGKDDITMLYPPPPEVRTILANSCYDCHSNHTRYPWYAEIQPFGWWLANHVRDGKRKLNFAEFGAYSPRQQVRKLESVSDEVSDRTMPLKSYTFIHRGSRLTAAQVDALGNWADAVHDRLDGN